MPSVISFVAVCGEKVMAFANICCNGTMHERQDFASCCGNEIYYRRDHVKCVDGKLVDNFE